MKFEVRKDNEYYWGKNPPWIVDRVLDTGDRYLVARFKYKCDADALMEVIKCSIEWKEEEARDGKGRQHVREENGEEARRTRIAPRTREKRREGCRVGIR